MRLALLLATACDPSADPATVSSAVPTELEDQEGAVCGMLVRDQPAPRGQVLHRDGTRLFLCSLGDLLVHVSHPSPHGEAQTVFVEVLEPGQDPMASDTNEHPWIDARDASYVVGVPRRAIMGPPILAYRDPDDAARIAAGHPGAQAMDFDALKGWWDERR